MSDLCLASSCMLSCFGWDTAALPKHRGAFYCCRTVVPEELARVVSCCKRYHEFPLPVMRRRCLMRVGVPFDVHGALPLSLPWTSGVRSSVSKVQGGVCRPANAQKQCTRRSVLLLRNRHSSAVNVFSLGVCAAFALVDSHGRFAGAGCSFGCANRRRRRRRLPFEGCLLAPTTQPDGGCRTWRSSLQRRRGPWQTPRLRQRGRNSRCAGTPHLPTAPNPLAAVTRPPSSAPTAHAFAPTAPSPTPWAPHFSVFDCAGERGGSDAARVVVARGGSACVQRLGLLTCPLPNAHRNGCKVTLD